MKITKVKPYIIGVPFPMQGGNEFYFIKIETDEGFYGWGEMAFISAYHGKAKSLAQDIAELTDKFLIGRNPLQRTYIWNNIYQHNFLHHGDLLRMALLSGIDIALWDIAGKVTGMPLYDLLGGRYRDKIRSIPMYMTARKILKMELTPTGGRYGMIRNFAQDVRRK